MTIGCPHLVCSLSPTMRASTSLMPPPGNGTMNLTVWVGNVPCAPATLAASAAKSPAAHAARIGRSVASHSSAARLDGYLRLDLNACNRSRLVPTAEGRLALAQSRELQNAGDD